MHPIKPFSAPQLAPAAPLSAGNSPSLTRSRPVPFLDFKPFSAHQGNQGHLTPDGGGEFAMLQQQQQQQQGIQPPPPPQHHSTPPPPPMRQNSPMTPRHRGSTTPQRPSMHPTSGVDRSPLFNRTKLQQQQSPQYPLTRQSPQRLTIDLSSPNVNNRICLGPEAAATTTIPSANNSPNVNTNRHATGNRGEQRQQTQTPSPETPQRAFGSPKLQHNPRLQQNQQLLQNQQPFNHHHPLPAATPLGHPSPPVPRHGIADVALSASPTPLSSPLAARRDLHYFQQQSTQHYPQNNAPSTPHTPTTPVPFVSNSAATPHHPFPVSSPVDPTTPTNGAFLAGGAMGATSQNQHRGLLTPRASAGNGETRFPFPSVEDFRHDAEENMEDEPVDVMNHDDDVSIRLDGRFHFDATGSASSSADATPTVPRRAPPTLTLTPTPNTTPTTMRRTPLGVSPAPVAKTTPREDENDVKHEAPPHPTFVSANCLVLNYFNGDADAEVDDHFKKSLKSAAGTVAGTAAAAAFPAPLEIKETASMGWIKEEEELVASPDQRPFPSTSLAARNLPASFWKREPRPVSAGYTSKFPPRLGSPAFRSGRPSPYSGSLTAAHQLAAAAAAAQLHQHQQLQQQQQHPPQKTQFGESWPYGPLGLLAVGSQSPAGLFSTGSSPLSSNRNSLTEAFGRGLPQPLGAQQSGLQSSVGLQHPSPSAIYPSPGQSPLYLNPKRLSSHRLSQELEAALASPSWSFSPSASPIAAMNAKRLSQELEAFANSSMSSNGSWNSATQRLSAKRLSQELEALAAAAAAGAPSSGTASSHPWSAFSSTSGELVGAGGGSCAGSGSSPLSPFAAVSSPNVAAAASAAASALNNLSWTERAAAAPPPPPTLHHNSLCGISDPQPLLGSLRGHSPSHGSFSAAADFTGAAATIAKPRCLRLGGVGPLSMGLQAHQLAAAAGSGWF